MPQRHLQYVKTLLLNRVNTLQIQFLDWRAKIPFYVEKQNLRKPKNQESAKSLIFLGETHLHKFNLCV